MYPAGREADAGHRGTGVFYQALPAVGADGKNIMRLIPVQMVNGKFVNSSSGKPKMHPRPQEAACHLGKRAALSSSAAERLLGNPVSLVNTLAKQQGVPEQSLDLGKALLTVKSPALAAGKNFQISRSPPAQTVSELPASVEKQAATSSTDPSSSSGQPSVASVSSMTTVRSVFRSAAPPERLPGASGVFPPTPEGSKPHLRLIPKVSRRPNSPIKWVIEEDCAVASSAGPQEVPRAAAGKDDRGRSRGVLAKGAALSSASLPRSDNEHDYTFMCDGKVFFAAKRCGQTFQTGGRESSSPAAAARTYQSKKSGTPPSQKSPRQDPRIAVPSESDEVIDLCDDDCPDDPSQQAASVRLWAASQPDEDNVIFVSYIPPRSESGSAQTRVQRAPGRETEETGATGRDGATEQKGLRGTTGSGDPAGDRRASDGSDGSSSTGAQQGASAPQREGREAAREPEESAEPGGSGTGSQPEMETHEMQNSANPERRSWAAREPCPASDRRLRRMFGITAEVKVSLRRMNEAPAAPEAPLQVGPVMERSVEDVNQASDSKGGELSPQNLSCPPETAGNDVCKTQTEQTPPGELVEEAPRSDTGPLRCSHATPQPKSPVIGYVEPIEEDLSSSDEISSSQDSAARPQLLQSCGDPSLRRLGRARKRTMCPCCVPGAAAGPAAKSGTRAAEAGTWETQPAAEQAARAAQAARAHRRAGRTSVRMSCFTPKSRRGCRKFGKAAAPAGSDRLKKEQVKRLRELLKEKEAAPDAARSSVR